MWQDIFYHEFKHIASSEIEATSQVTPDNAAAWSDTWENPGSIYSFHRGGLSEVMARFQESTNFLVAHEGDEVVGMLRAIDNRIVQLFVRIGCHRHGIGLALFERHLAECGKTGYSSRLGRKFIMILTSFHVADT